MALLIHGKDKTEKVFLRQLFLFIFDALFAFCQLYLQNVVCGVSAHIHTHATQMDCVTFFRQINNQFLDFGVDASTTDPNLRRNWFIFARAFHAVLSTKHQIVYLIDLLVSFFNGSMGSILAEQNG